MADIVVTITLLSWLWKFLTFCFWYPWQCWGVSVRYTLLCPSLLAFMVFSWLEGVMCFWGEDHTKCHFHHIKGTSYQHVVTTDVDFYHLADRVFVRFLHYKITLSSPSLCESQYVYSILKKWRLCFPSFG